jgi:hypothetical protein
MTNLTYEGNVKGLRRTEVVPTLDAIVPEGNNIIWCSSLVLAWNELKHVAPALMSIEDPVIDSLNRAPQQAQDLMPESYVAIAGQATKDTITRIHEEMTRKFPDTQAPQLQPDPTNLLAYAYLELGLKYKVPYQDSDRALDFVDSGGASSDVKSFGVCPWLPKVDPEMMFQASVLFDTRFSGSSAPSGEFGIDLCRHTKPYQVVLAQIEPRTGLEEALEYTKGKIVSSDRKGAYLMPHEPLLVPNMFFQLSCRFSELETPETNLETFQMIRFKIDRKGVELASEAELKTLGGGLKEYVFNHPFLLYVKKRDREQPIFVMWVDNAELLTGF